MNALAYSLRMLKRDWRAGELKVLAAALVVAVASVSAVGFFTNRVEQMLHRQANALLGADLVVTSDHALAPDFSRRADALGLRTAAVAQFRSMVLAGGGADHLAEVKAVGAGYPLRGELRVAARLYGPDHATRAIPAPGNAWADAGLMRDLHLRVGDKVTLGALVLVISRVITYEPDRGADMFTIAPRLMINLADVPATGLTQPGSRVDRHLLLAGSASKLAAFRRFAAPRLGRGQRLVGVSSARRGVRDALARAHQFLGLAALVSVMLAGIAAAMAARRHVARHLDNCAIMRCVGASRRFVSSVYVLELLWLGLAGSALGVAIGYAAHWVLVNILGALLVGHLPPPSAMPVLFGLITGLVTLLGFGVPPLLHLGRVPPLRVLRRDLGVPPAATAATYGVAAVAMGLLLAWQSGDKVMAAYVAGGLVVTAATLVALALVMIRLLGALRRRAARGWRLGLANVARRRGAAVIQVLAFGIGIMALLLLAVVRTDLLAAWGQRLPPQAPNRFVINIQPHQLAPLRAFFTRRHLAAPGLYPMVRGRLVAINGKPVSAADYTDGRAKRLVDREFNLSWAKHPQAENKVVAGRWWTPAQGAAPLLSVEQGIAKTLGIRLHDRLTYDVAGERFTATVANLRKVEWDSLKVNFFVIGTPGLLSRFSASYITSFYLPPARQGVLQALVRQFPNFTVIDVSAIMTKVRNIIHRVSEAVEYVFLFTLLAGAMVMFAALQATQDARVRETAVMRTLGAGRRQLLAALGAEFVTLGVLSGLVAALAAMVVGYVLARQVFNLPYLFDARLLLYGVVGGGVGVGTVGYLATRHLLSRPPLAVLHLGDA